MAPLPPITNVAKVRVVMLQGPTGGHNSQNVHHVKFTGSATDADMSSLAFNWHVIYAGLFSGTLTGAATYISEDTNLIYVTATDLSSDTAPFAQVEPAPVPGAATQVSPVSTAFLLSHHVSRRYRGGHPRTYIPGVTPDNTTDGRTWITAAHDDILSWWTTNVPLALSGGGAGMESYPNISALEIGQVSYFDAGVRRVTPIFDQFTNTTADSVIRSQRRRVRLSPTPS